jgi:tartrate dehydratase alpha subunit/fumarate hydratase class I-like protein
MDLNYLYQRHQVSLFMAENAACEQARRAHRELAEGYAARIGEAKLSSRPLRAA